MSWLTAIAEIWTVRRTSAHVARLLAPAVGRTVRRPGGVPSHVWLEPYAVGYLVSLVTMVAVALRGTGPKALAFVQVDCWQRLTGIRDDTLGERICLLSASEDPVFAKGCADARTYYQRLAEAGGLVDHEATKAEAIATAGALGGSGAADYVWSITIERHLGGTQWIGNVPGCEELGVAPDDGR